MTTQAIHTFGLTRQFDTVRAVDGLTLDVAPGTIFGFLGPNGAGKTTTIRLLLGLLEPSAGDAQVLGYDVRTAAAEIRTRSGALLEHSGLYERLSAQDNLEFFARIWHLPAAGRQERIRELLTHMQLWERRQEPVGRWSHGMKQKLAVARTLLHRPELVFLDEPTAGLDPVAAAALRDDLESLAEQEGVTVFLTTHNLAEAERLCDQIGVIRRGRLVAVGAPQELRTHSSTPRVEIAGSGFDADVLSQLRGRSEVAGVHVDGDRLIIDLKRDVEVAPLVSLVVSAGGAVEGVHKETATLEEVFLTLMEEQAEA
ncbi:MAG: ABC transporter ATP-binding protein [Chloroflexota bacterium]|jgi:ABC-2 type transport system ATP-binding protein